MITFDAVHFFIGFVVGALIGLFVLWLAVRYRR